VTIHTPLDVPHPSQGKNKIKAGIYDSGRTATNHYFPAHLQPYRRGLPHIVARETHSESKKHLTAAVLFSLTAVRCSMSTEGAQMIDPSSTLGRELKTAEEFFALAKNANSPFMREYYRRVAERYLSSEGEFKSLKKDRAM
jgi:hypothetical protein